MGSGTLWKTVVSKHSLSLHLQMQVKTLPCREKDIYQQHPETLQTSLRQSISDEFRPKVEKCAAV